ncbi:type II secretion system protein [bacterium]|nr:type II secretion system protein [bacterium]
MDLLKLKIKNGGKYNDNELNYKPNPPRNDVTVIASTNDGGFADGRSKASPDSEKIEQTATKLQLRNFSSVEQIQDSECAAIQKNSYRNDWIASSDLRPPRNDGGINNRKDIHDSQLTHCPLSPAPSPAGRGEKKAGFTLAETLITIGIIGVVAAMTIPNLISKYQKLQIVSKLKRAYSQISQATKLAEADYGEISGWDFSWVSCADIVRFNNTYLIPYLKTAKNCECEHSGECSMPEYSDSSYTYYLNVGRMSKLILLDGTEIMVSFSPGYRLLFIDINGNSKPNVYGKDIFVFSYFLESDLNNRNPIQPVPRGSEFSRDEILRSCSTSGLFCAALIMKDGWIISKDYPWQ